MVEIPTAGYQSIRDWVAGSGGWTYIALQDAVGAQVVRVNIDTDTRSAWTHTASAQILEITFTMHGWDSEISGSLPATFSKSAIHTMSVAGNTMSVETFSSFIIQTVNDQLTVKHRIEIPQV